MDLGAWERLGYVALCVVFPAAWGALTAWAFGRLDRRRGDKRPPRPPLDYSI
jgi:hypothetical protein